MEWSKNEFSHGLSPEPTAVGAGSPVGILSRSHERGIYFAIFKAFSFHDSKPPSISMTE